MFGKGTVTFSLGNDKDDEMKKTMSQVYAALKEKGYDPVNQIVGYILSEDPTYITNHNNARSLICKLDRDELLQALVKNYLSKL
ncbi:MAG: IreB family regulatory phosphoprotein [Clostridia bacterium]|nr:IreB family regulatory phosphoprotein [Clostridia bacterium]